VVHASALTIGYTPLVATSRVPSRVLQPASSLRNTCLKQLNFNPLWTAFNVLANGIAIFLFMWSAKGHGTPTATHAMYVFAAFCLCAIIALFIQQLRFERKQRIAESLETLRWAFLDLQELAADSSPTAEHVRDVCASVVNKLASALTRISRKDCSSCVKLVQNDPAPPGNVELDLSVRTLCRDDSSRDREQKTFGVKHWIRKNTDFWILFDQLGMGMSAPDHFFCNNLPKLRGYLNTSIPEGHVHRRSKFLPLDSYYRRKDWVLPYRSTIVFRIAKLREQGNSQQLSIVGFLCVDSNATGVFSRDEVSLVRSIADCLYRPVNRYSQLKTTSEQRRSKQTTGGN
jgi:hypothetical protein